MWNLYLASRILQKNGICGLAEPLVVSQELNSVWLFAVLASKCLCSLKLSVVVLCF